jgi:hypothetical protein
VEEYHAQLVEIQESLHQSGVCPGDIEELTAKYAEKLRQAREAHGKLEIDPKKLVTDLLARCLIWLQLIKQRYVIFDSL